MERRAGSGSWGVIALVVLAAAGLYVLFQLRNPVQLLAQIAAAQAQLHSSVAEFGFWAPVVFTLAYAALMLLVWVPSWPWALLGGFLFGPAFGALYSLIGSTLGAIGVFALAKAGLAHRLPRQNAFVRKLDAGFKRDALEYVIALRVMPVMPFGIVHVAAGVLGVSLRTFALGTVVGMVPCVLIYAYLGSDLDRVAASGGTVNAATLTQPSVVVPLVAMAALALVPIVVRRVRERLARARGISAAPIDFD